MSTLTIQLPESLKKTIEALAAKEGYSVSQFLASAAGEKLAVVLTMDYLRREAAAGRREDFEKYLAAVPDVPPQPGDELGEQPESQAGEPGGGHISPGARDRRPGLSPRAEAFTTDNTALRCSHDGRSRAPARRRRSSRQVCEVSPRAAMKEVYGPYSKNLRLAAPPVY